MDKMYNECVFITDCKKRNRGQMSPCARDVEAVDKSEQQLSDNCQCAPKNSDFMPCPAFIHEEDCFARHGYNIKCKYGPCAIPMRTKEKKWKEFFVKKLISRIDEDFASSPVDKVHIPIL